MKKYKVAFGDEDWLVTTYRPMMAYMYALVCVFDFMLAPIGYGILAHGQWSPLTLQAGGLFHLSMGAIIGVSAWSRGQEKITYMETIKNMKEELPSEVTAVEKESILK